MVPGNQCCTCPGCGAVCQGRFQACQEVWDRGPQAVNLVSKTATGRTNPRARSAPRPEAVEHGHDPAHAPGGQAVPLSTNGRVVSLPVEQTAVANLAKAVEETVAAVGRRVHDDNELQLRSLLENIESRLDELTNALHQNGKPQQPSANGQESDAGS